MKLKKRKLRSMMKSAECYTVGPDYLSISYVGALEIERHLLGNVSNYVDEFVHVGDNVYNLQRQPYRGSKTINVVGSYNDYPIPLLRLNRMINNRNCDWSVDIFSNTFRLSELGHFSSHLDPLRDVLGPRDYERILDGNLTRVDVRIDLFYKEETKIPKVKSVVDLKTNTQVREYSEWERDKSSKIKNKSKSPIMSEYQGTVLTGWNIGNQKTKRLYGRCYDKRYHIIKSGKFMLYPDYLGYDSVHRIEYAFKQRMLNNKNSTRYTLREFDIAMQKCLSYMHLSQEREGAFSSYEPKGFGEEYIAQEKLKSFGRMDKMLCKLLELGCTKEETIEHVQRYLYSKQFTHAKARTF